MGYTMKNIYEEKIKKMKNLEKLAGCQLTLLNDLSSITNDVAEKLTNSFNANFGDLNTATTPAIKDFYLELIEIALGQGGKILSMLIRLLNEDAIYVFDYDGTLDAFKYAEKSLLPCRDDAIEEYCRTHNLYSGVYTLRTMQFIVPRLPKNNVYVLTRSELTVVDDKNNAILDNFDIIPEHIIHVQNADNKLAKLRELHRKTGKKIFFVEDSFKTILNAEECMDFVEGIHISEFIV